MRGSTFLVEMKDIEVMLREATANSEDLAGAPLLRQIAQAALDE